jgi:PIN domain nuclease of toxin-antitoxin system
VNVMGIGSHLYWWKEPEDPEKTQVTDTLYHIMLYISLWSRFELTIAVVKGKVTINTIKSSQSFLFLLLEESVKILIQVFHRQTFFSYTHEFMCKHSLHM